MYITRNIEQQMKAWLKYEHLALQIDGGRQVGKTTTILHFAKENFKNVVYTNLRSISGEKFLTLVEHLKELPSSIYYEELLKQFAKSEDVPFENKPDTVFIIDEIQEDKDVYEMVRDFTRNLSCRIIVIASNLTKILNISQPVGDIISLTIYPLSFLEFTALWGGREFIERQDLYHWDCSYDDWYLKAYKSYSFYGGYPDVVKSMYQGNYNEALERKKFLFHLLEDEVGSRFTSVFDRMMVQEMLDRMVELFVREKTNERYHDRSFTREEVKNCIAWLNACDILDYCDRYNFVTKSTVFGERFYFRDLGILSDVLQESFILDQATKEGILAENFVFKTLNEQGLKPMFGVYNTEELDFYVVSSSNDISVRYGVEVGSGHACGKTITKLLNEKKIDKAIFFKGKTSGGIDGNKITLPPWSSPVFNLARWKK